MRDKVLSEFVKHIADGSADFAEFAASLIASGAEFPRELMRTLYST
jgi:hypothetical protein